MPQNRYKFGARTFWAYSEMQCRNVNPHSPHSWDNDVVLYGPYMCWGEPFRKQPTEDDLRQQAGEAFEGMRFLRQYLEDGTKEAKAFDKLDAWVNYRDEHRLIGSTCTCGNWSAQCGNDIPEQWRQHVNEA